jgi:hypothetical protein
MTRSVNPRQLAPGILGPEIAEHEPVVRGFDAEPVGGLSGHGGNRQHAGHRDK